MQSEKHHKNLCNSSPTWVESAIVYQIFPDRFRRSGRVGIDQNWTLQRWGTDPSPYGFFGGDLYGVIDALDHFEKM